MENSLFANCSCVVSLSMQSPECSLRMIFRGFLRKDTVWGEVYDLKLELKKQGYTILPAEHIG